MATESGVQSAVSKGIMTFHPTREEFSNFNRYIAYMESQGAHRAGLAKIVPPKDWKPRRSYDDIDELVIPAPIQQVVTGQSGLFTQYNIQKKPMTVREFRKTANSDKFCSPSYDNFDELERKYWKNLTFNPPIYGADVNGSLYDPDVSEWNISRLRTLLDTVERESGITIEGVNTPYLYFGMWKTTFAWHTEDMDLYSINYLHFGEPKSWYGIPPEHGKRLERLAKGFFSGSAQNCEAFLRHKMTLISPSILRKYGIPFEKITQEAGEFMVTFPYSYHAGFNHGFNCAESTNFATQRWIDYGKQAILCSCRKDMVKISMDVFVRKFQPERYHLWLAGKDTAPIDHARPTPEAREFLGGAGPVEAELCCSLEDLHEGGERRSPSKQIIGTKRHRVCLEVPEEVFPKEEQDEEEYWKKARLTLQDSGTEEPRDDPAVKFTLKDLPFVKDCCTSLTLEGASSKTSSLAHSVAVRNGHAPAGPAPPGQPAPNRPPHKLGVASLLFHKTLSPREALQVHSYARGQQNPAQSRVCAPNGGEQRQTPAPDRSPPQSFGGGPEKQNPAQSPPPSHCDETKPDPETLKSDESTGAEESAQCWTLKSKRQPLSKLPCLHPLLRETISDEELQEPHAELEEEVQESEGWAKPLTHLWQNRPHNLNAEREYNQRMGLTPPYCAVCVLFNVYHQAELGDGAPQPPSPEGGKLRTKPLIPEMCFSTSSAADGHLSPSPPELEEDGTSPLVSCSQCCVRVHTSCYGVSQENTLEGWVCTRCEAKATTEDCCLCSLRGGALQRANNDKWVHVLCAVAVLEARFVNVTERRPVDLSGIPLQRFKLKCYYCKRRMKKPSGCCVQCSHGRCPTSFHPTCAQAAGILMNPDDWPFVVHVTCFRHRGSITIERNRASMRELAVGQKVICKHKNGRYYQCDVEELISATFYEVVFDDGSFSDNLFPEDIVNRDCVTLGPPLEGDVVQVRWTDGLIYGAKFVAAHVIPMYLVEFEDSSQLTVKRGDVYSLDEDLPKRVRSRLSVASDMRFDGIFTEKEVKRNSKRQRVINSRYRGDYIEPVVYRAIME